MKNLDRFTTGAFLGSLFSLVVAWIIDSQVEEATRDNWVDFFTILVAIFAASMALTAANRQIASNNEAERKRRYRELAAERATLPLALSELVRVCEQRIKDATRDVMSPGLTEFSELSENSVTTLKKSIELAESANQKALTKILLHYQVYLSRWTDESFPMPLTPNVDPKTAHLDEYKIASRVIEWATLGSMVSRSFNFSRYREEAIDFSELGKTVREFILTCDVTLEDYPLLKSILDERAKKDAFELHFSKNFGT